ncbi:hypothetical protein FE257_012058 [Aspergillus nanangensis]|uniref:Uncharacterized protein n=1 Tax=Aspergillus nanangensis TaxID=2582783 RepID=A0AAD4GS82_ASPNN|nr:hypothetical protein FE257_012058 [Aspergillus nanangensis]
MDSNNEEAPPPYSAVDPLPSQTNDRTALLRLRGGNAPISDTVSTDGSSSSLTIVTPLPPANFTSAAAYFVERPAPVFDAEQPFLEHQLTIYHRSQSKDFPRRPRCWGPRNNLIAQQDWDTFLKYLFPPHLGLASSSGQLPRQLRAEIQRDRKDRPQETDEQRHIRVSAVITEWNQYFFEPRAARLVFIYVTNPQNAPLSPLCPRCYPAATKASHENRSALAPVAGRGRLTRAGLPPAQGQPTPHAHLGYPPATPYGYPNTPISPVNYAPYGAPPLHNPAAQQTFPYYPQQPLPYQQWGWNAQPWPPQQPNPSPTKGGALGWIASLASEAQRYGERISERAERYGDQISAHADYYGRQVEEQAMAHGRWIEEQAGFGGRKTQEIFTGYNHPPPAQAYHQPNNHPYMLTSPSVPPVETTTPSTAAVAATAATTTTTTPSTPSAQRPRRVSNASISSDSSFSSIDSLSTTSELSSSDLATVRAQLLSLDDYHDRDLHEAALGLRRQLDNLRESRRQTRRAGRSNTWRNGFGHFPQNQPQRWESPQQHQRSKAERRAVKEETRATQKAFRDVLRRARDEKRERRRMIRNHRRQETRSSRSGAAAAEVLPLDQRLQNLELDQNHRESQSTVQSYPSLRSVSEVSSISPVSTPSTVSSQGQSQQTGTKPRQESEKLKEKLQNDGKGS